MTLLGLAGCGLPGLDGREPPTVSIVNIRPVEMGLLEQSLDLDLRIVNPNPEPLAVNGLRYTVSLDGGRLGSGASDQTVEVPRLGSTVVPVRLYVPTADIITLLGAMATRGAAAAGGTIRYSIDGDLLTGSGLGGRLPFTGGGEVRIPAGVATAG